MLHPFGNGSNRQPGGDALARRLRTEFSSHKIDRLFVALMLCSALGLVGCARGPQPSAETATEIRALQDQSITPQASLQSQLKISMERMSVRADWTIRNSSTSTEYFEAVKQRLAGKYRVISQTASALTMVKEVPGDSYRVEFKSSPSGSSVDAHFSAMPD